MRNFRILKAYPELYSLARSSGAKPLLQHATFQRIAMGRAHSVLSYDCRPQVLEFVVTTGKVSGAQGSNSDGPNENCCKVAQARVINSSVGSVKPISIAVTVYGKSRDLLSESDPLFFEVGLNAPINVSHSFLLGVKRL